MAVTLTTPNKWDLSGSAGDGTWLKITLPKGCASVMVEVDGPAWVDGPGGGYTDGAARSSGGRPTVSGEMLTIPVPYARTAQSIYVAGNGGARTPSVYPVGSEGR